MPALSGLTGAVAVFADTVQKFIFAAAAGPEFTTPARFDAVLLLIVELTKNAFELPVIREIFSIVSPSADPVPVATLPLTVDDVMFRVLSAAPLEKLQIAEMDGALLPLMVVFVIVVIAGDAKALSLMPPARFFAVLSDITESVT
jgi:hypothetical protein